MKKIAIMVALCLLSVALCAQTANIDAVSKSGYTALMEATKIGETETVISLIEAGANLDVKSGYDEGETALMWGVRYGHTEIVAALIEAGADLEIKDRFTDTTALLIAVEDGHTEIVKLLIKAGSDIHGKKGYSRYTALILAAQEGYIEIVKLLIEAGADLDIQGIMVPEWHGYRTALIYAALGGYTEVAKLLIEAGADLELKDDNGQNALLWAIEEGHLEIVKLLIEAGANIEAQMNNRWTALIYAALKGDTEMVKVLIAEGANLEAKSYSGETALIFAASQGHTDMLELLINAGADIENTSIWNEPVNAVLMWSGNKKETEGNTALIWAAREGRTESVIFLIEAGANLEAKNNRGDTALIWAAQEGRTKTVIPLIEAGANLEAKNDNGDTALMIAAHNAHPDIVNLMIEKTAPKIGDTGPGGGLIFNIDVVNNIYFECSEFLGRANWNDALVMAKEYRGEGYDDWYLPTKDELNYIYHNLRKRDLISDNNYLWSSSENERDRSSAWTHYFANGGANWSGKTYDGRVRAIRVFNGNTVIKGTNHNYYEIPYVGESSVLTKITDDAKNELIEKYNFPTVSELLDDVVNLESVYREDIPNENDDTALSVYRLLYALLTSDSNGITKLSFIEGEVTERQSYGQAIYILNSDETQAKLFSRDIYFGEQEDKVIGNNTYFKIIDDIVTSVMYELQSSANQNDSNHRAIIYRNKIENIQDKTELCKLEVSFPLIDKNNPYRYTIQNALDGNPATSYVENTNDDLMTIQFEFPSDHTFTDIALINGYAQSESIYQSNNRIKRIIFPEISTDYEHTYNLNENTLTHQEFTFENPITQSSATIEVTEIYEGTKYTDTSLAELDIKTDEGWLFSEVKDEAAEIVIEVENAKTGIENAEIKTDDTDTLFIIGVGLVLVGAVAMVVMIRKNETVRQKPMRLMKTSL